mgnify:CR=1 FL=1
MKRYQPQFKKLKESNFKDFGNLSRFAFDDDYKNYEYGKPSVAAENIWKDVNEFLNNLNKNLDLAGEFLSPGIKEATLKTIIENIKRMKWNDINQRLKRLKKKVKKINQSKLSDAYGVKNNKLYAYIRSGIDMGLVLSISKSDLSVEDKKIAKGFAYKKLIQFLKSNFD